MRKKSVKKVEKIELDFKKDRLKVDAEFVWSNQDNILNKEKNDNNYLLSGFSKTISSYN